MGEERRILVDFDRGNLENYASSADNAEGGRLNRVLGTTENPSPYAKWIAAVDRETGGMNRQAAVREFGAEAERGGVIFDQIYNFSREGSSGKQYLQWYQENNFGVNANNESYSLEGENNGFTVREMQGWIGQAVEIFRSSTGDSGVALWENVGIKGLHEFVREYVGMAFVLQTQGRPALDTLGRNLADLGFGDVLKANNLEEIDNGLVQKATRTDLGDAEIMASARVVSLAWKAGLYMESAAEKLINHRGRQLTSTEAANLKVSVTRLVARIPIADLLGKSGDRGNALVLKNANGGFGEIAASPVVRAVVLAPETVGKPELTTGYIPAPELKALGFEVGSEYDKFVNQYRDQAEELSSGLRLSDTAESALALFLQQCEFANGKDGDRRDLSNLMGNLNLQQIDRPLNSLSEVLEIPKDDVISIMRSLGKLRGELYQGIALDVNEEIWRVHNGVLAGLLRARVRLGYEVYFHAKDEPGASFAVAAALAREWQNIPFSVQKLHNIDIEKRADYDGYKGNYLNAAIKNVIGGDSAVKLRDLKKNGTIIGGLLRIDEIMRPELAKEPAGEGGSQPVKDGAAGNGLEVPAVSGLPPEYQNFMAEINDIQAQIGVLEQGRNQAVAAAQSRVENANWELDSKYAKTEKIKNEIAQLEQQLKEAKAGLDEEEAGVRTTKIELEAAQQYQREVTTQAEIIAGLQVEASQLVATVVEAAQAAAQAQEANRVELTNIIGEEGMALSDQEIDDLLVVCGLDISQGEKELEKGIKNLVSHPQVAEKLLGQLYGEKGSVIWQRLIRINTGREAMEALEMQFNAVEPVTTLIRELEPDTVTTGRDIISACRTLLGGSGLPGMDGYQKQLQQIQEQLAELQPAGGESESNNG